MKKVLVFGFIMFVSILGITITALNPAHAAEPIRIGAILSITGWGGGAGQSAKECMAIAVDQINGQGGVLGRPIELYIEDDQTNATNSVIAATKLIRDKKVCALIGAQTSSACAAILPLCKQEHVPVFFQAPTSAPFDPYVFHPLIDDPRHAMGMFKFMVETLKAKKIAILGGEDVGVRAGIKAIEQNAGQYGATIVAKEYFEFTDTNLTSQVTRIKAARPDVILMYGSPQTATILLKNYQQLGMTMPVVCAWGVASIKDFAQPNSDMLKGKPWYVFGLRFIHGDKLPASDPYHKVYDPFMKAYREKWHHEPQSYGAQAFDSLHIIAEAIRIANSDDRAAIRDAIEKVKWAGLVGDFSVTPTEHYGMKPEAVVPQVVRDKWFWPYKD